METICHKKRILCPDINSTWQFVSQCYVRRENCFAYVLEVTEHLRKYFLKRHFGITPVFNLEMQ